MGCKAQMMVVHHSEMQRYVKDIARHDTAVFSTAPTMVNKQQQERKANKWRKKQPTRVVNTSEKQR